ncbi:histidine phosphatase family protein [Haloglycomyces albus]|uniref:histidine phosphatase family protein n=1 Tax=Haloglycomyces albus TaxID=526067 RepID=UPI00046D1461|nr:histidine phosphatase family protein [Haloglycomyces albus]
MSHRSTVTLLRHGPTSATRRSLFPSNEPLDRAGRELVAHWCGRLVTDHVVTSDSARCLDTAELVGYTRPTVDSRWAELDFGDWSGHSLAHAAETDSEAMSRWLDDPFDHAPPNGETFASLSERVDAALSELASHAGHTLVITSAGPIKAALLSILHAPTASLWRIDVAPGTATTLTAHSGIWTLRSLNVEATS